MIYLQVNEEGRCRGHQDANHLGVIQHNRARHITPRECARLQGFPDTFRLHPTDAWSYKQFGNSVSVPVVEAVFNEFLRKNIAVLGWAKDCQTPNNLCVNG